ncbi:hypothetical protein V2G26_007047 [Clonostachys chloroleuca]
MDGEIEFPSPVWAQEANIDGLIHDVDQENRPQSNDITEEDERRRRGPTHSVLHWPRPAATYQAPPHRPVLPREPHIRPAIHGLVRRTRIRRGRSAASANEGRAPPLRELRPRGSTGLPETGEQAYPSPWPTQQVPESETLVETREAREEEKHQKRRRGRPVTCT